MRRWIENSPATVGVLLILFGLAAIFLAWNGAAGKDFVEGQIPYLISGGLGGLVSVGAGATTIVVQARRQDTAALTARLDEMIELLRESATTFPATGPTAVPTGAAFVAGRSSFHEPDCRIVEGRDDFRPISAELAEARGLAPCRICQPEAASA